MFARRLLVRRLFGGVPVRWNAFLNKKGTIMKKICILLITLIKIGLAQQQIDLPTSSSQLGEPGGIYPIDIEGDGIYETLVVGKFTDSFYIYDRNGTLVWFHDTHPLEDAPNSDDWVKIVILNADNEPGQEFACFRNYDDGIYVYDPSLPSNQLAYVYRNIVNNLYWNWRDMTAIDGDGDGNDELALFRDDDFGFAIYEPQSSNNTFKETVLNEHGVYENHFYSDWNTMVALDGDGDGNQEIALFRDYDNAIYVYEPQVKVNESWSWKGWDKKEEDDPVYRNIEDTSANKHWKKMIVIDADGDDDDELVLYRDYDDAIFVFDPRNPGMTYKGSYIGLTYNDLPSYRNIVHPDGAVWPDGDWKDIICLDADGDGENEVAVFRNYGNEIDVYDPYSSSNSSYNSSWVATKWWAPGGILFSKICAADIDGDGDDEIVALRKSSSSNSVQIFDLQESINSVINTSTTNQCDFITADIKTTSTLPQFDLDDEIVLLNVNMLNVNMPKAYLQIYNPVADPTIGKEKPKIMVYSALDPDLLAIPENKKNFNNNSGFDGFHFDKIYYDLSDTLAPIISQELDNSLKNIYSTFPDNYIKLGFHRAIPWETNPNNYWTNLQTYLIKVVDLICGYYYSPASTGMRARGIVIDLEDYYYQSNSFQNANFGGPDGKRTTSDRQIMFDRGELIAKSIADEVYLKNCQNNFTFSLMNEGVMNNYGTIDAQTGYGMLPYFISGIFSGLNESYKNNSSKGYIKFLFHYEGSYGQRKYCQFKDAKGKLFSKLDPFFAVTGTNSITSYYPTMDISKANSLSAYYTNEIKTNMKFALGTAPLVGSTYLQKNVHVFSNKKDVEFIKQMKGFRKASPEYIWLYVHGHGWWKYETSTTELPLQWWDLKDFTDGTPYMWPNHPDNLALRNYNWSEMKNPPKSNIDFYYAVMKAISTNTPMANKNGGEENLPSNQLKLLTFSLVQNYPNPFNPITKISFEVPEVSNVKLTVFDQLGRKLESLVNSEHQPGKYDVDFDGSKLASGVYFYRIQAGSFVQTKKMILMK